MSRACSSLLVAILCALPVSAGAQDDTYRDHEVKAGFLFHLVSFVEWPEDSVQASLPTMNICTLGHGMVARTVQYYEGKPVGGRTTRILAITSPSGLDRCHIVFVSAAYRRALGPVHREAARHHVLSVSDRRGYACQGGTIGLINRGSRVGLQVSREALEGASLKLRSNVLELAEVLTRHDCAARALR